MSTALLDKREARIRTMFGNIAPRYDLLNHLLSLNIDRYWRLADDEAGIHRLARHDSADVCTGINDLALAYDKAAKQSVPICMGAILSADAAAGPRQGPPR